MATSMADAMKGLVFDFSGVEEKPEMTEEQYQAEQDVKMLEECCKLNERKASEKELFNFARKWDFLSYKHFSLWLSVNDDYHNAQDELEDAKEFMNEEEIYKLQKKVQGLESQAKAIRGKLYYQIVMRQLQQKDFSPYGENLLKRKSFDCDTFRTVDIEKTVASGYQYIMSYKD